MTTDVQFKSIVNWLLENECKKADSIYLRQPHDQIWQEFTWADVVHKSRQVARFLMDNGLKSGDHVSIYSKNCAEWFIADFGITLAGMINVPLFANQHKDSIDYVVRHANVAMIFVGKLDAPNKSFMNLPADIPTISFDYHEKLSTNFSWLSVMESEPLLDVIMPKPDDLYTIIYSSGTTGFPKGVMFTHEAIAQNLEIFPRDLAMHAPSNIRHRLLSYLPLAHVYERSSVQLASVCLDCDVSFVQSLEKFAANLQEVQPTLFAAVPRIWSVFKQKIEKKIPERKLNILLKIPFVSRYIKRKISNQLGLSECLLSVSGAAHLPIHVIDFFSKIGIFIQEGYGQTENLAYGTLSLPNLRKSGFVGSPRFGVKIKQGKGGELLTKSPCLMAGYYKDATSTTTALTSDGWLCTGDIVEIDKMNRVKILGRISENFKNQKGEFVAPTPIEDQFESPELLEHMCLVGRGLPSNVLLVDLTDKATKTCRSKVKEELKSLWHIVNRKLLSHEKISHIVVTNDSWTIENGCLTPTQKVKRLAVEARYHAAIQKSLTEPSSVLWES